MKPIEHTIVTLSIAFICGAGGYLLGKQSSRDLPATQGKISDSGRFKQPSSSRQPASVSEADLVNLHAKLDAEENPLLRMKLATQSMEAWVSGNPQDALRWLASQQPSQRRNELTRLALKQFSENDAKGAAEWALKNLTGASLNNSLIAIAENWANQNGHEAANWLIKLPQSSERDAAIENMYFAWASNEPEAALQFLTANPDLGELSPTLQRAALAGWAKSDPLKAVATSLELSQANKDPGLFGNTLANWATMDLQSSSDWLLANLKTGDERAAAVHELATIYAQQSPDAGLTWLGKLNAGQERDAAANSLVTSWARTDAPAAAEWAAKQTGSTLLPPAASAIAHNFLRVNPAAFEKWRDSLPEGLLKSQASQLAAPEATGEP